MGRIQRGYSKLLGIKRNLRSNMTTAEKKLWSKLRDKQLFSIKFRRQHGIGPYIVDFYCPEKSLVIEVDGDIHVYNPLRDQNREFYLKSLGLKIIRYTNNDILKNLDGVLMDLYEKLSLSLSTSPLSPPYKGGEIIQDNLK